MTLSRHTGGLREAHKERTRAALVQSALRLFTERSYATVTVEDICLHAEVSPRTFFRYFATKENVLAAPIANLLDATSAALTAQPAHLTPWVAIRRALTEGVDYVDAHAEDFRRAGCVIRRTPSALAASAETMTTWEQTMRAEVARRLGAAEGSEYPALLLGTAMVAYRVSFDGWLDGTRDETAGEALERCLDSIAPGALQLQRRAHREQGLDGEVDRRNHNPSEPGHAG